MGERNVKTTAPGRGMWSLDLVALATELMETAGADAMLDRAIARLHAARRGLAWAVLDRREGGVYQATATPGVAREEVESLAARVIGDGVAVAGDGLAAVRRRAKPAGPRWCAVRGPRTRADHPADLVLAAWSLRGDEALPARSDLLPAARLLVRALATSRAMEHLLEQNVRDPLTGALNRRGLLETLRREIRVSRRFGRPLALLYVDLDDFKAVNDAHGHAVGDTVLVAIAGRLRLLLRASDAVGRIGGDEFIMVLPDTDQAAAQRLSRRLERELLAAPVPTAAGPLTIQATFGASELGDDETEDDLLRDADGRMLRRKRRRRGPGRRGVPSFYAARES